MYKKKHFRPYIVIKNTKKYVKKKMKYNLKSLDKNKLKII
jgi:hypothetical protein